MLAGMPIFVAMKTEKGLSYGVKCWEEDLPTTLYNTLSICFLGLEPLVGGKYSWRFRF